MSGKVKWNKFDFVWSLNLFGTAVGAGVLFLPINAGMKGFWPLVVLALLAGPMTYLAHQGLSRFVLSSSQKGDDITVVAGEYFGANAAKVITLLYFFAIFPILLIYGNGITNTVGSFLVNQLGMENFSHVMNKGLSGISVERIVLSGVLISLLIGVMLVGEKLMLRLTEYLVYPLLAILLGLSLYLIPHWNTSMLNEFPSFGDFFKTIWLALPVIVFSFNHSPAISQFSLSQERQYGTEEEAERHASHTLKGTATLLTLFVMLFVFSCVLSLTPEQLTEAKEENISILSYLANKFDNPWITYLGPAVAFLAITSSFFGHYLGAREGIEGLYLQAIGKDNGEKVDRKKLNKITAIIFFIILWIVAVLNPSILGTIESLGGPFIATILFLMPMYAIAKVPAMKKYSGRITNVFVTVMGVLAVSAVVLNLF